MVRGKHETGGESVGLQLSRAKGAFADALKNTPGDPQSLTEAFTSMEELATKAAQSGLITPLEQFTDLNLASNYAVNVCEQSQNTVGMSYFVAKAQTFDMLVQTFTPPVQVEAPQQTDTHAKAMAGAKHKI